MAIDKAEMECRCSNCGRLIGRMVTINGQEWLSAGGVACRALHGVCMACGTEFHWSVSDRMLARLVNHVLESRRAYVIDAAAAAEDVRK